MKRKGIVSFSLFLIAIFCAPAVLLPGPAEARNIKVGILDTYSGPPAVFGNDALNGFKMAVDEINKQGVLGGKIEYVTRDDKFKVDIGLNMAKELVLKENVDVLVGVVNSGVALAVSDAVAKKEKIPFFTWMGKSENITGKTGHRYVFSSTENTAMACKAAANVLSKKPYKKIWVAGDDYEYGHALDESFSRYMKQLKPDVEFVGKTWWKLGEPDLIPYFTSIQAANPDLIHFCTGGASMANVLKTIKTTGINQKIPVYIHTAIDYAVLKPLGTEAPEGVMGTMDYLFYYPELSTNQKFVKDYQALYKVPPGFPAFHAYTTAHFIAEGFRKAGAIDKEKFIDAVEGIKVDTPVGRVEMRACDHQAILPIFFGTTKISKEYGAAVATDIITLRGAEVMPSCEEIQAARK
ncbi:MAG: ABC transporter substrate-binding protein [Desulfobacterales bacterium]|jgi:branched-chain amino acid transport system substrate-binding protein|nr:ABC transporter substrate-binding protein [Desulfobacterales bacterium]